jgi:hypothetical protein
VKTTFSDNQEQFIFQFVRDFYSAELQAAAPSGYLFLLLDMIPKIQIEYLKVE